MFIYKWIKECISAEKHSYQWSINEVENHTSPLSAFSRAFGNSCPVLRPTKFYLSALTYKLNMSYHYVYTVTLVFSFRITKGNMMHKAIIVSIQLIKLMQSCNVLKVKTRRHFFKNRNTFLTKNFIFNTLPAELKSVHAFRSSVCIPS